MSKKTLKRALVTLLVLSFMFSVCVGAVAVDISAENEQNGTQIGVMSNPYAASISYVGVTDLGAAFACSLGSYSNCVVVVKCGATTMGSAPANAFGNTIVSFAISGMSQSYTADLRTVVGGVPLVLATTTFSA